MAKTAVFEAMMGSNLYCEHNYVLFSSPGHRPYELLPSGFVRHPLSVRRRLSLAFHILIFSSKNTEPI
jgi:hypothetical protein